jgi:hypothetical protein
MPLLIGLGVGAGAGLAKTELIDQPQYQKQKQLAAATQRYSPWTGMKATAPEQPNPLGNMMQFGATGAALGQGVGAAQQQQAMNQNMGNWMNAQTNYLNNMNPATAPIPGGGGMAPGMMQPQMNPWAIQPSYA